VEATISRAKTWCVDVYVKENKVLYDVTAQGLRSITALIKMCTSAT
jgi:hypothetical protein